MSGKPFPIPDPETAPFWEAAEDGRLVLQKCGDCGAYVFYPRIVCPSCLSEALNWVPASGRAIVHSVTVVHRAGGPFRGEVPFAVALVDLEEGPRMMSRILTEDPASVAIGDAVTVSFVAQEEGPPLPFFRRG